jgi:hypothetical protein
MAGIGRSVGQAESVFAGLAVWHIEFACVSEISDIPFSGPYVVGSQF